MVGFNVGPSLVGFGQRAGTRIVGLSAQEYARQSILTPGAYLVPGHRSIMYADYGAVLSTQDVKDLIAYLLTL